MHVFVLDETSALQVGALVTIDGREGHHAVSVRRVALDEPVEVVDGRGTRARGRVVQVQKRACAVAIEAVEFDALATPHITVVQALLKSDRSERAVELMTELGVDRIVPWQASRSISIWDEAKGAKAIAKWQAVAREAAKQSRQSRIPQIESLASTSDVVSLIASVDSAYVLHESAPMTVIESSASSLLLIVGPEGGLTTGEVGTFTEAGAHLMRLGPTVLRGSTAGAIGAAVVLAQSSRWKDTE